jgi:hypothetical protein
LRKSCPRSSDRAGLFPIPSNRTINSYLIQQMNLLRNLFHGPKMETPSKSC